MRMQFFPIAKFFAGNARIPIFVHCFTTFPPYHFWPWANPSCSMLVFFQKNHFSFFFPICFKKEGTSDLWVFFVLQKSPFFLFHPCSQTNYTGKVRVQHKNKQNPHFQFGFKCNRKKPISSTCQLRTNVDQTFLLTSKRSKNHEQRIKKQNITAATTNNNKQAMQPALPIPLWHHMQINGIPLIWKISHSMSSTEWVMSKIFAPIGFFPAAPRRCQTMRHAELPLPTTAAGMSKPFACIFLWPKNLFVIPTLIGTLSTTWTARNPIVEPTISFGDLKMEPSQISPKLPIKLMQ